MGNFPLPTNPANKARRVIASISIIRRNASNLLKVRILLFFLPENRTGNKFLLFLTTFFRFLISAVTIALVELFPESQMSHLNADLSFGWPTDIFFLSERWVMYAVDGPNPSDGYTSEGGCDGPGGRLPSSSPDTRVSCPAISSLATDLSFFSKPDFRCRSNSAYEALYQASSVLFPSLC